MISLLMMSSDGQVTPAEVLTWLGPTPCGSVGLWLHVMAITSFLFIMKLCPKVLLHDLGYRCASWQQPSCGHQQRLMLKLFQSLSRACPCHVPGVTLNSSIRRRPNCFNLVHQLEFLSRTGISQEHSVASLQASGYNYGEVQIGSTILILIIFSYNYGVVHSTQQWLLGTPE